MIAVPKVRERVEFNFTTTTSPFTEQGILDELDQEHRLNSPTTGRPAIYSAGS